MELLLRTLRPTTDALCQAAAELRSDWARLLSRMLHVLGSCSGDSGAASVFVHGDRIFSIDVSPGDSAEEAGETTESVSADPAPRSPDGQSVDVGGCVARDQSQSAERFGAAERSSEESWIAFIARRGEPAGGAHLGAVE